jgi:hypothetical protein
VDILTFVIKLFIRTFETLGGIGGAAVDAAEANMRAPLQLMGVDGALQTLLLALVPLLTLIATYKLLHGMVRFLVMVTMVGALARILWPLVGEMSRVV